MSNLLEAVSCSSRNTFNKWAWMSSSSLPGERTLRHTMNKFVPQQLCYFVGHACGIPPLGAAPDLEYFANIVERYATIRWRRTKLLFPQFFDSCSDPNAHLCSSEECDPYTSVYETSPLCLLGQYSSVGKKHKQYHFLPVAFVQVLCLKVWNDPKYTTGGVTGLLQDSSWKEFILW